MTGVAQDRSAYSSGWVIVGQVTGLYGIQGWLKVFSHTQPRAGITHYAPLYLQWQGEWQSIQVEDSRCHGKGVILKLQGYDQRTTAARLLGCALAVRREQFAPPAEGEYYWTDLLGLRVVTVAGVELGRIVRLLETGANDVIVVAGERERLLPFLQGRVITRIDLAQGVMEVDWDPEF